MRAIAEPGLELDEASAELQCTAAITKDIAPRVRLRVQGALAIDQRFGTSVAWQGILGLVAAQRRWAI